VLSYKEEGERLSKLDHQAHLAQAITNGLLDYFKNGG